MIQRIQTIYLLVAAIAAVLLFVLPMATFTGPGGTWEYTALAIQLLDETGDTASANPWPVAVLAGLMALMCGAVIALFKNRPAQLRLGKGMFLLGTALLVSVIFYFDDARTLASGDGEATVNYGFGLALPVLALIMVFLANRSIRKDEELVKSVDRLR